MVADRIGQILHARAAEKWPDPESYKAAAVLVPVQETADGEVAVLHDSDFMKVAGSPLKIWEASFAEVRMLDIGSSFGPEFVGEPVPTLEEVLMRAKGRAKVVIELKYYGHDQQLEERVAAGGLQNWEIG